MISFVIPALDEAAALESLLPYLRQQNDQAEMVVAAYQPDEPTSVAARRWGAKLVCCPEASRGIQLNAGARAATGGILCFLHADVRPPAYTARQIEAAFRHPDAAGGGFRIVYDFDHPGLRLLAALSALPWRTAYFGDQGFFCRAKDFWEVGGYPPWPLFEEVGLAYALARRGRLIRSGEATTASARRFTSRGVWHQLSLNAGLWTLFHLGVSPRRLAAWYSAGDGDGSA
jgi:rSAM/selenodomain-associated transferase 2